MSDETTETDLELRIGLPVRLSFELPPAADPIDSVHVTAHDTEGESLFDLVIDDEIWSDWRVYLAFPPGLCSVTAHTNTGLTGRLEVELTGREPEPPGLGLALR